MAGGCRLKVLKLVLAPVLHLNPLADPSPRGPRGSSGASGEPSLGSHKSRRCCRSGKHHIIISNGSLFAFQLSKLPLSAISLSVFSCHPAHLSFPPEARPQFFWRFSFFPALSSFPLVLSVFHKPLAGPEPAIPQACGWNARHFWTPARQMQAHLAFPLNVKHLLRFVPRSRTQRGSHPCFTTLAETFDSVRLAEHRHWRYHKNISIVPSPCDLCSERWFESFHFSSVCMFLIVVLQEVTLSVFSVPPECCDGLW